MSAGARVFGRARVHLTLEERQQLHALVAALGWREAPRHLGIGQQTLQAAVRGEHVSAPTRARIVEAIAREARDSELLRAAEVTP